MPGLHVRIRMGFEFVKTPKVVLSEPSGHTIDCGGPLSNDLSPGAHQLHSSPFMQVEVCTSQSLQRVVVCNVVYNYNLRCIMQVSCNTRLDIL